MMSITKLYHILGVTLSLESDSKKFFQIFDLDFSWAKNKTALVEDALNISVIFNTKGKDAYIRDGNNRISLEGRADKFRSAYYFVLRQVLNSIQEYYLLHAGVASKDGRTIVVSGVSGSGKTTVIMELLKRNFLYFSDDYCPISRKAGLVYPYPRSLWKVVDGSSKPSSHPWHVRAHKQPVVPLDMGYRVSDWPHKPTSIFYLTDGDPGDRMTRLIINGCESVVHELGKLENVKIQLLESDNAPELSVQFPQGQGLTEKVDKIFFERGDELGAGFRIHPVFPNYEGDPELSVITVHDMVFRLMTGIQNMRNSVGQEKMVRPGAKMMELCDLLKDVPCFLLKIGNLESMIDLIIQNG